MHLHSLTLAGLQIRVCNRKLFFIFLSQTFVVGSQKNRLNEHTKHMFKHTDKERNTTLCSKILLHWTYALVSVHSFAEMFLNFSWLRNLVTNTEDNFLQCHADNDYIYVQNNYRLVPNMPSIKGNCGNYFPILEQLSLEIDDN